jgi:hypothetical protein
MRARSHPIPWAWLAVPTCLISLERVLFVFFGARVPPATEILWLLTFTVIVTWWVQLDLRAHGLSVPFEFEALVFWAWPLVVPYYLYRTRGRRGLVLGAALWFLWLFPLFVAVGAYVALVVLRLLVTAAAG